MGYDYHKDGTTPLDESIFVFGSNLAGIHGAGAAKVALRLFGAKYGIGEGLVGRSYAIPTKDEEIMTLPLEEISKSVTRFSDFARSNPEMKFWVTKIGCGLAGYNDEQIAPMFKGAPSNCNMPLDWKRFL
jgi:hypothetical protein